MMKSLPFFCFSLSNFGCWQFSGCSLPHSLNLFCFTHLSLAYKFWTSWKIHTGIQDKTPLLFCQIVWEINHGLEIKLDPTSFSMTWFIPPVIGREARELRSHTTPAQATYSEQYMWAVRGWIPRAGAFGLGFDGSVLHEPGLSMRKLFLLS